MLIDAVFAAVLLFAITTHLLGHRRKERAAREAGVKVGLAGDGPQGQHPHIEIDDCIGCGACVTACPEGDVLAVIGGKAGMVNGHKCIGHGLCAEACPVGAIEIVMAPPSMSADLPALTPEYETSVENLFVVGELGGLALIKNAVNQGRDAVDTILERLPRLRHRPDVGPPPLDLVVVGAGPGGISASLRAQEQGLSYLCLEAEDLGGTVAKYPRQKLVMTSPVEFPMYGKFKKLEITKESLLALWTRVAETTGGRIHTQERVEEIRPEATGRFTVRTAKGEYQTLAVVLAIGRRGTPRKLGVPGEELPHVMYSLLDAEAYTGRRILVVGGGDSAVEAAMGLAHQKGNRVVLSYRKGAFSRLKDRNQKRLQDALKARQLEVVFESAPVEIRPGTTVLDVAGARREVAADYVWVFAGGSPPKPFLEKIGIRFGRLELSDAAHAEAEASGGRVAAA